MIEIESHLITWFDVTCFSDPHVTKLWFEIWTSPQMLWMLWLNLWSLKAGVRQSISHLPTQDPRNHDLKRKISAAKSPQRGLKMVPFNVTSLCRGAISAISLFFIGFMRTQYTNDVCGGLHAFGGHLHLDILVTPSFPESWAQKAANGMMNCETWWKGSCRSAFIRYTQNRPSRCHGKKDFQERAFRLAMT